VGKGQANGVVTTNVSHAGDLEGKMIWRKLLKRGRSRADGKWTKSKTRGSTENHNTRSLTEEGPPSKGAKHTISGKKKKKRRKLGKK